MIPVFNVCNDVEKMCVISLANIDFRLRLLETLGNERKIKYVFVFSMDIFKIGGSITHLRLNGLNSICVFVFSLRGNLCI